MKKIKINIAKDFTDYPGPRYISQGEKSGEAFRNEILMPKYNVAKDTRAKLYIDLDGVYGYPPSFLEEAFGGLVRVTGEKAINVIDRVEFKCKARPYLNNEIKKYMIAAEVNK